MSSYAFRKSHRKALAIVRWMAPDPPRSLCYVRPEHIMVDHPDPVEQLRSLVADLRAARAKERNGMTLSRLASAETAALRALVEAEKATAKEDLDDAGTTEAAIQYLTSLGYTVTDPDVN